MNLERPKSDLGPRFSAWGACLALTATLGCSSSIGGPSGAEAGAGGGASGTSSSGGVSQGGSVGTGGSSGTSGTGGSAGASGSAGTGGEPPLPPDDVERACVAMNGMLNAGITKLRRMTRTQYDNTVRDLVG